MKQLILSLVLVAAMIAGSTFGMALIVSHSQAQAQSPMPTVTDTPEPVDQDTTTTDTVPEGSPQTGFGTL